MPGKEETGNRVCDHFDSMSTAELKEVLYLDSLLPEDECLDVDTILHISRILAERGDSGADKFTPVKEAWKNFNDHYRSMESDGKSLYDDSTTAVEITDKPKRRRPWRSVLRVACVAAALLILMFAGSLTAYALGYDLWGEMAEWTKETFGFELPSRDIQANAIYEDFEAVRETLDKQNITFDVLPQWLPDGYRYAATEIAESPGKKIIYLEYVNGEKHLGLTISRLKDSNQRSYEKDESLVQMYEANGTTHYILQNNAEIVIVWTTGNCECSLRGSILNEEATRIIDSIYGG